MPHLIRYFAYAKSYVKIYSIGYQGNYSGNYNMSKSAQYMYQTGHADKERLDILNAVYNPHAKALLYKQNLSKKKFSPDLIYSRWLLVHLPRSSRQLFMNSVYQILSKNGIAIFEDINLKQSYTESTAYKKWLGWFRVLGKQIDVDFDIGEKLEQYFLDAGFKITHKNLYHPIFKIEQQRFFNLDLYCTKKLLIKHQICTEEELQQLQAEISQDLAKGASMSMMNIQMVGIKDNV